MLRRKRPIISLLLSIFIIIGGIPFNTVHALPDLVGCPDFFDSVSAKSGAEDINISPGDKGVPFNLSYIDMDFNDTFSLASQGLLSGIKVYANGSIDETYKFNVTCGNGVLKLSIKNSLSGANYMQPYQLIKHALYNIYIPEGTFKDANNTKMNAAINYTFVTGTDEGGYGDDILVRVSPADGGNNVDNKTDSIVFEFIDDIAMEEDALNHIDNYITVSCEPYNADIPGYRIAPSYGGSDSVANYNVSIEGNKLILRSKAGVLKDFARYTVKLRDNTVYLKNSPDVHIHNFNADSSGDEQDRGFRTVRFYTNNMLESTYPANNQENVEVEPTIKFQFKYPISVLEDSDKSRIAVSSDAGSFSVDIPEDIKLSGDGKTLMIDVNDIEGANANPLRRSTLYKVTIPQGTVRFRDYSGPDNQPISNNEINLYFITRGEGEGPEVTGYSSNAGKTDDITCLESTKLDSTGSIYIHFDRAIRLDKQAGSYSPAEYARLYKIPRALSTAYDPSGRIYDSEMAFYPAVYSGVHRIMPAGLPDSGSPEDLEKQQYLEEVIIGNVEVIQPNILRITPGYPLYNLNKYKMVVDNRYIEDTNGYNAEKDIEFTFWTKASSDPGVPAWEGVTGVKAQSIKEDMHVPYKSYTLYGVPQYNEYYPDAAGARHFVLNIDREVIPKARDEILEERPSLIKRISFDSLEEISLTDAYNTDTAQNKVGFSRYELEYYFKGGAKKTRLHLYPGRTLEYGKYYQLVIPPGVFETRSGNDLGRLEVNFVIEGNRAAPRGVYSLENNRFRTIDLAGAGEWEFTIKGYNFAENISKVTLTPTAGGGTAVDIPASDISFTDVTKIRVKLRGSIAKELSQESRAGTYTVALYFSDAPDAGYTCAGDKLVISSRGKPEVVSRYPYSADGSARFDENSLNPVTIDGVQRFFLRVTFKDLDGRLEFNDTTGLSAIRDSSSVCAQGSGSSMIDADFINKLLAMDTAARQSYIGRYLFSRNTASREAYLYIPVKPLKPQTTYNVAIAQDIVFYPDTGIGPGGNETITWSFTTMPVPAVNAVSVGSVAEDYDEDEPLILTGDLFYDSSVSVYFNGEEAEKVVARTDAAGRKYLEVYLPGGRDRLKPGTYNIIVQNDDNHKQVIYGSLSVVKAGERLPNEKYRVKSEDSKGDVLSDLKVSEDTVELKSKYNDDRYVKLDLDELMGEEVLVRKIKFRGSARKEIGVLETKSKWCDIEVYGLSLSPEADDNEIILSLGRTEPALAQALKAKLRGKAPKSDFIQVTGDNFKLSGVSLAIPFRNSSGKYIKVMRYDEESRNWYYESFSTDLVDMRVEVESDKPGIFVVVE